MEIEKMVCIGECKQEKLIKRFSFVGRKNESHRRKVCNQCHGVRGYQSRLKYRSYKGDKSVSKCFCGKYFSVKIKDEANGDVVDNIRIACSSCRRAKGLIKYWKPENKRATT